MCFLEKKKGGSTLGTGLREDVGVGGGGGEENIKKCIYR